MARKKVFIALLAFNIFIAFVYGGTHGKSSYGIRIGYAISGMNIYTPNMPLFPSQNDNVKVDVQEKKDNYLDRQSIHLQFSWDYKFKNYLEFETGLATFFSGAGEEKILKYDYKVRAWASWNTYSYSYYAKYEYKLTYLQIPVLFRLVVPFMIGPYLELGGAMGFNLTSKYKSIVNLNTDVPNIDTIDENKTTDLKNHTNFFDYGILVGIGVRVKQNFYLSLRVYEGLKNIFKKNRDDTNGFDEEIDNKNGSIRIILGVDLQNLLKK